MIKTNPSMKEIRKRRRERILDVIIGIVMFCLGIVFFLGGADWAVTMNWKSLAMCMTAAFLELAIAFYLNTREDLR